MAWIRFYSLILQISGPMIRVRYKITKLPPASVLLHDENGYYLPMTITVRQSAAMQSAVTGVTHGHIEVTDGKLYFGH